MSTRAGHLPPATKGSLLGDFTGAFADAAVLLPLVAAVAARTGGTGTLWLASAGIAYLAAGCVFRVPMSVQPLKSVAIASLALGASAPEIRLAGFAIGLAFALTALWPRLEKLAERVPSSIVYSIQFALGTLLVVQACAAAGPLPVAGRAIAAAIALFALLSPLWIDLPVLGAMATVGVAYGAWRGAAPGAAAPPTTAIGLRPALVAALVLPQLALTSANSVLATRAVARKYFGEGASRVTVRRLVASIGLGNLASAAIGGLPFCHGSGGLTAHVRGGATTWRMNAIAGISFLVIAGIAAARGGGATLPPVLVASLLFAIGVHHVGLARPMLASRFGKLELAAAGIATLATQNLLFPLGAVIALELARAHVAKSRARLAGSGARLSGRNAHASPKERIPA